MSKIGHPFKCSAAHGVWDFLSVSWTLAWPSKEATSATFCAVDTYTTRDIEQLAMWRIAPGCVLTPVRISSGVAHHAKVFVKPKDSTIRLETKLSVPEMQKLGYGVAELRFEPLNVRP
ncbi:hypothetical protein FRB90_002026 [Tulasnella sp. 427]|nr:hypothetical protein FRB90_002026 [Tulasnella sp. 427]